MPSIEERLAKLEADLAALREDADRFDTDHLEEESLLAAALGRLVGRLEETGALASSDVLDVVVRMRRHRRDIDAPARKDEPVSSDWEIDGDAGLVEILRDGITEISGPKRRP